MLTKRKVSTLPIVKRIKLHKFLTPALVILGVILYSAIGSIATENLFRLPLEWLFALFGAVCLGVNLYLFAMVFKGDDSWASEVFFFSLIIFSLIFCSMTLKGTFQEYAFIALSIAVIIFTIDRLEGGSINAVLQFLSIIITYFFLASSYYTFGKTFLDRWLSLINYVVNVRLLLFIIIAALVLGEGVVKAFQAERPHIPLIPYIGYIPPLITNPLIGIVEGFKKSGVWIRNNAVYFFNLVWTVLAHIGYYIVYSVPSDPLIPDLSDPPIPEV